MWLQLIGKLIGKYSDLLIFFVHLVLFSWCVWIWKKILLSNWRTNSFRKKLEKINFASCGIRIKANSESECPWPSTGLWNNILIVHVQLNFLPTGSTGLLISILSILTKNANLENLAMIFSDVWLTNPSLGFERFTHSLSQILWKHSAKIFLKSGFSNQTKLNLSWVGYWYHRSPKPPTTFSFPVTVCLIFH